MRLYISLLLLLLPGIVAQEKDICAPLKEAEVLLATLQPSVDAHLQSRIGGIAPFGNRGWAERLGWDQSGPLSATLRLLPRLIQSLSPSRLLSSTTQSLKRKSDSTKISRQRKERIGKLLGLMDEAEQNGCNKVWEMRGRIRMFPPKGIKQDLKAAYSAYKKYLETTADPAAQFIIGVFHSTGLGGVPIDQGKTLLYYTFAATQGYRPASMALGYRHWAGIGVKEDCESALDHYMNAAETSYQRFLTGPPGGLTPPLSPTRLSDRVGGIYGPHASWASTGANALRPAIRAASASARGETTGETLEYYQYHSDRGSHLFTLRLGKVFYHGSVHFNLGGVSSGAESVGKISQSFSKARSYFLKIARVLWPMDFEPGKQKPAGRRKLTKEQEENVREAAMVSASFLGRMALRGEGQKTDYKKAKMWYERAAELGDREAMNGLGIMYRDGLGIGVDLQKAQGYFQAAASGGLPEAQTQLAKIHLARNDLQIAYPLLENALRGGNPLEAFHLSARLHSSSRSSQQPSVCGVAVAYEKLVSERGSWEEDYLLDADKAWARGDEGQAVLGYYIAAEMGYEAAQNDVAFLREGGWRFNGEKSGEWQLGGAEQEGDETTDLVWWVRSAGQDNVDAMVKLGDHYYEKKDHTRALSHYLSAADSSQSPMAYWNLGWMYQTGLGVSRDWHLAKRYYDLAKGTGREASLAVGISLWGLYLQSWWTHFKTRGATPGLPLFEPSSPSPLSSWTRFKSLFALPALDLGEEWEEDPDGILYGDADPVGGEDGWEGRDWEGETMEEVLEDLLVIGLVIGIGSLMWLRARWANGQVPLPAELAPRQVHPNPPAPANPAPPAEPTQPTEQEQQSDQD
ncbi:hypothetical protein L204_103587 [Cryptococcus depauperatus]|nr:SEL1 protein [Cryptococcus depauperatus CBS 7855]